MSTSQNITRAEIARGLRSLATDWREGKEPNIMTACYMLFLHFWRDPVQFAIGIRDYRSICRPGRRDCL